MRSAPFDVQEYIVLLECKYIADIIQRRDIPIKGGKPNISLIRLKPGLLPYVQRFEAIIRVQCGSGNRSISECCSKLPLNNIVSNLAMVSYSGPTILGPLEVDAIAKRWTVFSLPVADPS